MTSTKPHSINTHAAFPPNIIQTPLTQSQRINYWLHYNGQIALAKKHWKCIKILCDCGRAKVSPKRMARNGIVHLKSSQMSAYNVTIIWNEFDWKSQTSIHHSNCFKQLFRPARAKTAFASNKKTPPKFWVSWKVPFSLEFLTFSSRSEESARH